MVLKRRRWSDRGSASVELVLTVPLLLLVIMGIIQAGIWMHAQHCAQAAATHAAEAARAFDHTAAQGHTAGEDALAALAQASIHDGDVAVERTATTVTATVTGTVDSVFPGVTWSVNATVNGPVERFTETDGQKRP